MRDLALRTGLWVLAVLFVALAVHLVAILLMPALAPADAFVRLAGPLAVGKAEILAPASPESEPMPFSDPAVLLAVCRYDLSKGPLRVSATAPDDGFLSLSFHDRLGRLFYALTDRAAQRGRMEAVVVDRAALDALEAQDAEDEQPQELRLLSPTQQGFVIFRSLAPRPDLLPDARRRLEGAGCALQPQPGK